MKKIYKLLGEIFIGIPVGAYLIVIILINIIFGTNFHDKDLKEISREGNDEEKDKI